MLDDLRRRLPIDPIPDDLTALRSHAPALVQTALAAGAVWFLAEWLLGERPVYAVFAVISALGVSTGDRPRRTLEVVAGASFGVVLANLFAFLPGPVEWQLVTVMAICFVGGLLVFSRELFVVNAAFGGAMRLLTVPGDGWELGLVWQGLIGAGVALAVSLLVAPVDPVRHVRDAMCAMLTELGEALAAGPGLGADDPLPASRQSLLIDQAAARLHTAVDEADVIARFSWRRPRRRELDELAESATELHAVAQEVAGLLFVLDRHDRAHGALPDNVAQDVATLGPALQRIRDRLDAGEHTAAAEQLRRCGASLRSRHLEMDSDDLRVAAQVQLRTTVDHLVRAVEPLAEA